MMFQPSRLTGTPIAHELGVPAISALVAVIASLSVTLLQSAASAQEDDEAQPADTTPVPAPVESTQPVVEEVVVTGSRLRRDTFSSISPLQVISGQVSREIG